MPSAIESAPLDASPAPIGTLVATAASTPAGPAPSSPSASSSAVVHGSMSSGASSDATFTSPSRTGPVSDQAVELERHRQHPAAVVVGVLADQVDAPGRAHERHVVAPPQGGGDGVGAAVHRASLPGPL